MKSHVLAAVEDMIFAAKIRATAEQLGVNVEFPRTDAALLAVAHAVPPALILVDLHTTRHDFAALAAALKADPALAGVPLIGFFSHVNLELMQRARAAGFDRVLARSGFVKQLPELLTQAD